MNMVWKSCREWVRQLHRPGVDVLTAVALLLLVCQCLIVSFGGVERVLLRFPLSCYAEGVSAGAVWTLLSYAFVHAGWLHLGINLLGVWIFGGKMMRYVGAGRTLSTLLLGILGGGLCHLVVGFRLLQCKVPEPWLVGVSGGVMALWICLTVLAPEARLWPLPIRGRALRYGLIGSLVWLVVSQPELGFLPDYFSSISSTLGVVAVAREESQVVSHACHLGGAFVGLWMGRRVLGKMITREDLKKQRMEREKEELDLSNQ